MPHTIQHCFIVIKRCSQKFYAAFLKTTHSVHDISGIQSNMLYARATVEFKIFFNLRLAPPRCWFVYGKFDAPTAILHDLRHEGGIFGADSAIIKMDKLG